MSADVKWIKIVTDIFDDDKIRFIETLPEGDALALMWFKLLCLAGRSNRGGLLMMTDRIAYTEEMLATVFRKDIKLVRLAIATFEQLDMIEVLDDALFVTNWEKHQSAEKLAEIREQTRRRVAEYRERKRMCNADTVTPALQDALHESYGNGDVTRQNKNKTKNQNETKNQTKNVVVTGADPGYKDNNILMQLPEYVEKGIGHMTPGNWHELNDFMADGIAEDMVRFAVDECAAQKAASFAYLRRMLNGWLVNGYSTLEAVKAHEREFQDAKLKRAATKEAPRSFAGLNRMEDFIE